MRLGGLWNLMGRRGSIKAKHVRALAAQVDAIANNEPTTQAVQALKKRIETLIDVISASRRSGKTLPRDLEKSLVALVKKLKRTGVTRTSDAALARLESRVATLMRRLDASDAKLGHLEAIERGRANMLPAYGQLDLIAAARRAAQAAALEHPVRQAQIATAAVKAAPTVNKFAERARNVVAAVAVAVFVFGGLHVASRAGLLEEIVTEAAQFVQFHHGAPAPAEPGQEVVPNKQAQLETTPALVPPSSGMPATVKPAKPDSNAHSGQEDAAVGAVTPLPSDRLGAGAMPSWAMPEITGALSRPEAMQSTPSGPARPIVEDKLPAAIGNPALRAAAMAGDPAAAYEVASRFGEGHGVPQNNEDAARWLERAARQGLAPAQFHLGTLFEKGIGVKKDLVRARDLYLAAAQKGNAKAMHNLAVLYAEGVTGTPDYKNAASWFLKAADHGIKDSQFNLAVLYARGIGVDQNYAESYKWFVLAANQGDTEAAKKRDEVAALLDPQTLGAARLAAQSWSPQPQPDDAINVKTPAAWEAPAEVPHPVKPKPRPALADTRTADGKPN
jgi:localization factor PodJL